MIAVVERDVHPGLGAGEQQSGLLGVFAHNARHAASGFPNWEPVGDLRPALPKVACTVDVRREVAESLVFHGRVGFAGVHMRCFDGRDIGAARVWEIRDADVGPRLAFVARDVDQSVVGANPNSAFADARRRKRLDGTAPARGRCGGRRIQSLRDAELTADFFPAVTGVGGGVDHVHGRDQQFAVPGREQDGR